MASMALPVLKQNTKEQRKKRDTPGSSQSRGISRALPVYFIFYPLRSGALLSRTGRNGGCNAGFREAK